MVNISHETPEQVTTRLKRVIQESRLVIFDGSYAFEEFPLDEFQANANGQALALVRDNHVWSQLVESDGPNVELFTIWRFHFPEGADNSGFVGWLAMHLKERFGTGVFVICGQNNSDGGIFDYWGCPWELRDQVVEEVRRLATPSVS